MDHATFLSSLCSHVVVKECRLSMDLAQSPDLRHRKHNMGRVCFADFGRHKVDSLYPHRVMIYEVVMAA